mgnify:CR=1 FL=1
MLGHRFGYRTKERDISKIKFDITKHLFIILLILCIIYGKMVIMGFAIIDSNTDSDYERQEVCICQYHITDCGSC